MGIEKHNNTTTELLCNLKETASYPQQEVIHFIEDRLRNTSKKVSKWKAAGPDGVHGF